MSSSSSSFDAAGAAVLLPFVRPRDGAAAPPAPAAAAAIAEPAAAGLFPDSRLVLQYVRQRTVRYLCGGLCGATPLSFEWIAETLENGLPVHELNYCLAGDRETGSAGGPLSALQILGPQPGRALAADVSAMVASAVAGSASKPKAAATPAPASSSKSRRGGGASSSPPPSSASASSAIAAKAHSVRLSKRRLQMREDAAVAASSSSSSSSSGRGSRASLPGPFVGTSLIACGIFEAAKQVILLRDDFWRLASMGGAAEAVAEGGREPFDLYRVPAAATEAVLEAFDAQMGADGGASAWSASALASATPRSRAQGGPAPPSPPSASSATGKFQPYPMNHPQTQRWQGMLYRALLRRACAAASSASSSSVAEVEGSSAATWVAPPLVVVCDTPELGRPCCLEGLVAMWPPLAAVVGPQWMLDCAGCLAFVDPQHY